MWHEMTRFVVGSFKETGFTFYLLSAGLWTLVRRKEKGGQKQRCSGPSAEANMRSIWVQEVTLRLRVWIDSSFKEISILAENTKAVSTVCLELHLGDFSVNMFGPLLRVVTVCRVQVTSQVVYKKDLLRKTFCPGNLQRTKARCAVFVTLCLSSKDVLFPDVWK